MGLVVTKFMKIKKINFLARWFHFTSIEDVNTNIQTSNYTGVITIIFSANSPSFFEQLFGNKKVAGVSGGNFLIRINNTSGLQLYGTNVHGFVALPDTAQYTTGGTHTLIADFSNGLTITIDGNEVFNDTAALASNWGSGFDWYLSMPSGVQPWKGNIYFFEMSGILKYNCDEVSGLVANDTSGNNNNGTITLAGATELSFFSGS